MQIEPRTAHVFGSLSFKCYPIVAVAGVALALVVALSASQEPERSADLDKLTYHNDPQRSGWNDQESILTPAVVSAASFGSLWSTPQLDSYEDTTPLLFASPLYVERVPLSIGAYAGRMVPTIYAVSSTGYAYAISAFAAAGVPAGEILWRNRLTDEPCARGTKGNLSTPVVDLTRQRLYVTSCHNTKQWQAHAIDIRSGETVGGWPVTLDAGALNAPGINANGAAQFPGRLETFQRGALNLSPDKARLYVTFGEGATSGWIVAIDTEAPRVASAFSVTASSEEHQGGIWASGGPAVDASGNVYVATGASIRYTRAEAGIAGMFPDSPHSWGQSILRLSDKERVGFELVGTYTPFNYCQAGSMDIDLGSSGAVAIDLDPMTTSTPYLLALGGAKQGNVYLLDRKAMPGSLTKRQPCSDDSASDQSLLPPEAQPQFGKRGPVNVFGPYSETRGLVDMAKSRSTLAYFRSSEGTDYVFVTGSSKTGDDLKISVPPGLVRLKIVTRVGEPAYLEIDQREDTQRLFNPGSPIVTSNGGKDAIVWVLDPNAEKSTPLYSPEASKPVLYAFDALSFRLLWKSEPGELAATGRYNEPTVVHGTVFVGTDRIQAFGVRQGPRGSRASATASVRERAPSTTTAARQEGTTKVEERATKIDTQNPESFVDLGRSLYEERCAKCHSTSLGGVPPMPTIAALPFAEIVETLVNGSMQNEAFGLRDQEIGALVSYLRSSLP